MSLLQGLAMKAKTLAQWLEEDCQDCDKLTLHKDAGEHGAYACLQNERTKQVYVLTVYANLEEKPI